MSAFKKEKQDEEDGGTNMFQNLDKTAVLQDTRMFNVTTINAKKCNLVLLKILYLINQGEKLTTKDATDVFFNITKSFQSNDIILRRLVYLAIKELCHIADDVIIVTSSLTKDMTGKEDLFRAAAIRALCAITDASMLQAIERYMRQAIVDKNPAVSSAALVSALNLFNSASAGEVIKRWANEVQEALLNDNIMVQYHALGVLYQMRKSDRLAVMKLVTKVSRTPMKSPYVACLLIRIASKILDECDVPDGQLLQFIESLLRHKSEMVMLEAANAVVNMRWTTNRELAPALSVLQLFCGSSKATVRFAAMRLLNKIATTYPNAVANCNVDIENLITDSNRSVATLAITTLLKTGSESSVERLMKQISNFMTEITDEFKVVVIESIKALSLKYPAKTQTVLTYLSSMLREEGGLEYKVAIAEAIIKLIDENSEASEIGLSHLCEFIEDCEHSSLAIRVLHLLGREGPKAQNPQKYIRYIYNRVILEQPQIRMAAVSALAQIAASCSDLRNQILVLLERCHYDSDCDVRDMSIFYCNLLTNPKKSLATKYVIEPMHISILGLERALVEYLMQNDYSKAFNIKSVPIIDPKVDSDARIYSGNIDDLSKVLQQNHVIPKSDTNNKTIDKHKLLTEQSFIEKLSESLPNIEKELGPLMKSCEFVPLTEAETEYIISLAKHCYSQYIILQFHCVNTLNDQLLEDVKIWLDLPEGYEIITQTDLNKLPYGEFASGSIYVMLKFPENLDDSLVSISGALKFIVKDCDPVTGEPDSDQGYNDEYSFEEFEISLADQMVPIPKVNFWQNWNDLDNNEDFTKIEETYALSSMKTLEDAISNIIVFLGLMPAERSEKIGDSKTTHTLLLTGMFRGGYDVFVCAKLAVSEATGITMKLIVRSSSQDVNNLIVGSVG